MKFVGCVLVALLLLAAIWYGVSHRHTEPTEKLPRTMEEFERVPGGKMTVEAGEFLLGLAREGKLPGFSQGEHGAMQAGNLDARANTPSGPESFPISRVIHFQKEGDDSDFFYEAVLQTNGGAWRLERAWRTDPQGRVVNLP